MFLNTSKRLARNSKLFGDYDKFMQNMLDNNFMEVVPDNELVTEPGKCWYLTHHSVYHSKKGKIRIVFNCSLKCGGTSLNDELLQGPDITNGLFGVLLRFRQEQVAVVGDIEKMYYQVRVPKYHADYLRLFWFDDSKTKPIEFRLRVHVFGATSSPSVANFALRQTALEPGCPESVKNAILTNFYVDDFLCSVNTEEAAVNLMQDVKATVANGGFNLTSFNSNSEHVLAFVPKSQSSNITCYDLSNVDTCALGVRWRTDTDELGFKIKISDELPLTKRIILKNVASIYDPLGVASPALVPARKLFQEACRRRLDWDVTLPDDIAQAWRKWKANIVHLAEYAIPRCLKVKPNHESVELHIFTDGSETAYGSVAYLKFIYGPLDSDVSVSLVASKSRLTPLNNSTLKTVPRIELCSAKLGVELSCKLKEEFTYKIDSEYFWTDSVTVLRYIKNENKRFHRFVDNKVSFIRNFSSPDLWYYVPSKLNPADIISRGCTAVDLVSSALWNCGPAYLKQESAAYPDQTFDINLHNDNEVKVNALFSKSESNNPVDVLMTSASNWYKLKVRVGWFLKLKGCLRSKSNLDVKKLLLEDLREAELVIIKYFQTKHFSDDHNQLKKNLCVSKSSCLRKLTPFIDESGLLRVGGRLDNSHQSNYDIRHPIILPGSSMLSELIVRDIHSRVGHLGRESILSTLRKKFWIIRGSSLARKIVHNCVACRKRQAKPSDQLMGHLPSTRVTGDVPAFTNVGLDFFGPFHVVHGRKSERRYGVIFTCMASRAIHIELAHSLTTDSFINALRRFICRRGNVSSITSDNGTNFVGGNRELRESISIWNESVIEGWLKQRNIAWHFNPPTASHFGGVFEREIRSVRNVLAAILNEQNVKLTDENLCTLMCEVEAILNNRPLTSISNDPNDLDALTPNHLLLLNAGVTFPPGLFSKDDCYVKRRWRQVQYLVNLFWSRWRKQYLVLLQERQKWCVPKRSHKVGDLVLVMDSQLPRNQWPLGRIIDVLSDKYGNVRVAKVKVAKCKDSSLTNFGTTVLERPIVKLILLRCSENV